MTTFLLTCYMFFLPGFGMAPAPDTPGGSAIPGSPARGVVLELDNWDYIEMSGKPKMFVLEVK